MLPQRRGRDVAEHGARPARQHRGQPAAFRRRRGVADGVTARCSGWSCPRRTLLRDGARGQSGSAQSAGDTTPHCSAARRATTTSGRAPLPTAAVRHAAASAPATARVIRRRGRCSRPCSPPPLLRGRRRPRHSRQATPSPVAPAPHPTASDPAPLRGRPDGETGRSHRRASVACPTARCAAAPGAPPSTASRESGRSDPAPLRAGPHGDTPLGPGAPPSPAPRRDGPLGPGAAPTPAARRGDRARSGGHLRGWAAPERGAAAGGVA